MPGAYLENGAYEGQKRVKRGLVGLAMSKKKAYKRQNEDNRPLKKLFFHKLWGIPLFDCFRRIFRRQDKGLQNFGCITSSRQRINRKSSDLRPPQSQVCQDWSGMKDQKFFITEIHRVCHGFRLTKGDDCFWVTFDHFWSRHHFFNAAGAVAKIGWSLNWSSSANLLKPKSKPP